MTIDLKGVQVTNEDKQSYVKYEVDGRIAIITLNRPKKLNAFNDDMVVELSDALHRFDTDPDAWVAVLTGAGRAFSSGADVHARQLRPREELIKLGGPQARGAHGSDLMVKFVNWKPVVGAVHGYAMGLGLGLALECDLLVAEENTKFQVTEIPRGLAGCRYWALLRFRSTGAFADEIALTGRFFSAQEAKENGLITAVASDGKHVERAMQYAEQIAKNPPLSTRSVVRMRRWYMDQVAREALLYADALKLHLTEDFKESARAFAEKREAGPFFGR